VELVLERKLVEVVIALVMLAEPVVGPSSVVLAPLLLPAVAPVAVGVGDELAVGAVELLRPGSSGNLSGWPELPAHTVSRSMTRGKLLGLPC
jgi:hypothetical protein